MQGAKVLARGVLSARDAEGLPTLKELRRRQGHGMDFRAETPGFGSQLTTYTHSCGPVPKPGGFKSLSFPICKM